LNVKTLGRILLSVAAALLLLTGTLLAQTPSSPPIPVIQPVVNRDYLPVVLNLINGAKKTVDFIQLEFHYDPTVKQIQEAMRAAAARGVSVRGLIEDSVSFNRKSQTYLEKYGIDAVLDTPE
jgi:phosphatidylserine/phosphatidylglycerophosphate/cardiolipin synthase-like enzyme